MTQSYTANACVDLARIASTVTVKTIGFAADGSLDISTAIAFLAGAQGRVYRWYDQSGRGQHAMQGSGLGPLLDVRSSTGVGASLIFDTVMMGTTGAGNHPNYSVPNVSLVIPAGQTLDSKNMTVIFLGRARSNIKPCAFFSVNNNSGNSTVELSIASQYPPLAIQQGITAYFELKSKNCPAYQFVPQTPFIGGVTISSGLAATYANDRANTTAGVSSGTIGGNGATIGGVGNTEFGYVEMSEIRVDQTGFSAADWQSVALAMTAGNRTSPQIRGVLVYAGDSITEGYGSTSARNVSRQVESLLKHPVRIFNNGVSGETLQTRLGSSGADGNVYQLGGLNNIVILAEGTNDIGYGSVTTGAQLFAYASTYCKAMRTTGFKIVIATICPAAGRTAAQIQIMADYNSLIRTSGLTIADAISDRAADPDMGSASYPTNSALCADGIHPTSLGYSYFAQIDAAAINGIMI